MLTCIRFVQAQPVPVGTVTPPGPDNYSYGTSLCYDNSGNLYAWTGVNIWEQPSGGTFSVIGQVPNVPSDTNPSDYPHPLTNNSADPGPVNFSQNGSQIVVGNGYGGAQGGGYSGQVFTMPKSATAASPLVATLAGVAQYNNDIVPVPSSFTIADSVSSYFVNEGNASYSGSSVSVFDSTTGKDETVIANIPGASSSIAINPATNRLYVEDAFDYNTPTSAGYIRSFSLSAVESALNSDSPLNFGDGQLFNAVAGEQSGSGLFFDKDGYLLAGGDGADGDGGVVAFNPDGSIANFTDFGGFTTITYNSADDQVLVLPYGESSGSIYDAVQLEPEPASLGIVAFGGLLLLRRKPRIAGRLAIAAAIGISASVATTAQAGPYQLAGPYATNPALGPLPIPLASTSLVEWASGATVVRGLRNVENPTEYSSNPSSPLNYAFFGGSDGASAAASAASVAAGGSPIASTANTAPIGMPASTSSSDAVALGQNGSVTLTFSQPITDGAGTDFAVFGNGFSTGSTAEWIKPALVSVSSDGVNFFSFPAVSFTPTTAQVGNYGELDPSNLYDIAGKDPAGYGTPFDLSELSATPGLNVDDIIAVRISSVSGDINKTFANLDSDGNIINSPWPAPATAGSEGFDLAGVGVINVVPECNLGSMAGLAITSLAVFGRCRRFTGPIRIAPVPA